MCRMENQNQSIIQSSDLPTDPDQTQKLEETRPFPGLSDSSTVADKGGSLDVTQTIAAGQAEEPAAPKGFEETSVFPVEPPLKSVESRVPPAKRRKIPQPPRRSGLPWFVLPLTGIAILLFILLVSGFAGYQSGIGQRKNAEKTQVASLVEEQFQLAVQDVENGAYDRARQRIEYVIRLDPGYPGASDKLAEILLAISTTATPTILPTVSVTPTPDTRDVQQLYDNAQQALAAGDWSGAIDNLLVLRKSDPAFRTVEVDGTLFIALRNRGRDKILKDHDLEGGIYDLTLSEKFGPLDAEAKGLLSWSSLYITGASFWGIDWEQAVNYFSQVAPQMPNLMDASKMTATERLRQAYFEYGNTLAARGQYCAAVKAYQNSIAIAPNEEVQQAGELAAKGCSGDGQVQATQKPGKKPKNTPTP
jgi:tetratricopeptide (TPR) repeat protein